MTRSRSGTSPSGTVRKNDFYDILCLAIAVIFTAAAAISAMNAEYGGVAFAAAGAIWMVVCAWHADKSSWNPLANIQRVQLTS